MRTNRSRPPSGANSGPAEWVRALSRRIRAVRPEPSDLGKAAVDDQVNAVDEAGVRGGEEQRGGRDFRAGPEPSQGDEGLDLLAEFGCDGGEERGIDRAGAEDVHPDTAVLQFRSPGAGE